MEFTDQNFNEKVEKSKKLVLVEFFAPWCGPCKLMAPIMDELIKEFENKDVKIGKLNIDDSKEVAGKYNIMSIPTLILFRSGEVVEQIAGLQSKESLQELINKNLSA